MTNYPKLEDFKLVALDLDGTVICSKGERPISTRIKTAIAKVQEAGLPVTFVTGRTEDYAEPIAHQFGLKLPLVTYNGCRLYCPQTGELLFEATIELEVAKKILDELQEKKLVTACYVNREGELVLLQNHCSGRPEHDDYLFGSPRHLVGEVSSALLDDDRVSKIIVSTLESLESEIEESSPNQLHAVRTHPELIEILPPGVSKGEGVLKLCQHLQIKPKEVLAIGDQRNDLSTFAVCGYSVAMGDAPEDVKEKADFVTSDFEFDGCAEALEMLFGDKS